MRCLASGRDLELKVINNLLDLWLGELLDLLDNESEVLSHLRAHHQALLVAGLMVVNKLAKDLLRVLKLREAEGRVAPLDWALGIAKLGAELVDNLLCLLVFVNVSQ